MVCTTDRNGQVVRVGSTVRVLSVEPGFLRSLPPDEREQVSSMVGEVLAVYEVNQHGFAMVETVWNTGDGESTSHSVALASQEMLLVTHAA